jgi:Low-density lipoprotein receptor repeat class B
MGIRVAAITAVAALAAAAAMATMSPAAAVSRRPPDTHFTPDYGYGKVLPSQTVSHRFTLDNATRRHSQARVTSTGTQPGHIYWTNPIAGSIGVANLDGSDPHTIIRGLGSGSPEGLAVSKAHITGSMTARSRWLTWTAATRTPSSPA